MESPLAVVSFGKSLLVPSVQELEKEYLTKIPARYVRPQQESLVISDGSVVHAVPVIDLKKLISGDSMDSECQKLHSACQECGFLQVINHGLTPSILEDFKKEVTELFKLPMAEKKKLWQQEDSYEGFGQLNVVSEEQKLDWSDMFGITTLPPHIRNLFQKLPLKLRDIMEAYCKEIKSLAISILSQTAKALRMDEKEMRDIFSDGMQSIRVDLGVVLCCKWFLKVGKEHVKYSNALVVKMATGLFHGFFQKLQKNVFFLWITCITTSICHCLLTPTKI